jgi:two-component system, NtrC family, nitrogen regulation sensor histidine kinase NtrY
MSRFEIKIVAALLLIAVIPLGASVVLVGQVIKVSNSVAEGQTRRLAQPLDRAASAYRELFAARKHVFRLQASLIASDGALRRALEEADPIGLQGRVAQLLGEERALGHLALVDARGQVVARAERPAPRATRALRLTRPIGDAGHRLSLVFHTPRTAFDDFNTLGVAQGTATHLTKLRDELAVYYRVAFLIMFGAVLIVATGLGLFIARRTARRVTVLAAATRKVAEGDLETQVQLRSRDELGDLANAFNEMVGQIKESRERIAYLEKIGAWQEIARRLAHEIKNPLTPIQLAVQQLHSKYSGGDAAFSRLLDDARDIITEEVDALRRLVHDFSSFAKLPSVQPEPVDVNSVVDDFLKSHSDLEQKARIVWQPVTSSRLVLVDRMLIKHVLYNLVENAVQAAEEEGQKELTVTLSAVIDEPRHRTILTVDDDGPGMDEATAQRAFDPYFTTKEKGTGLGLAIVKKIILEHRGTIAVHSARGEGTRFVLALPLVVEGGGRLPSSRVISVRQI